jgi:hypothetical protein
VDGLERKDMLNFKIFLKGKRFSKRYVYNNFLNVMIFLKWAKVEHGVQKGDWPAKPERDPEEYTDEEITKLLDEAYEERFLLSAFLCSGFLFRRTCELHLRRHQLPQEHLACGNEGEGVPNGMPKRKLPIAM